jgi:hypothetical protein
MAQVTLIDLRKGKILENDDCVKIAGENHTVRKSQGWFLKNDDGHSNSRIFEILNITDKFEFAEKYGHLSRMDCIFPEFDTLKDLTKCVRALMEVSIKQGHDEKPEDLTVVESSTFSKEHFNFDITSIHNIKTTIKL